MKFFSRLLVIATLALGICATGCAEESVDDGFVMKARVDSVGEKIEVTVIEAPHGNTGPFWVITSDATEFFDENGREISKKDIVSGATVEICYNGQVMMSYPPQIYSYRIKLLP